MTRLFERTLFSGTILATILGTVFSSAYAQEVGDGDDEEDEIAEIVVTGQRGSILNSLQEKRNADSVADILSADQAGRFPDPNVAEALARLPGIGFQRENDTGQGEFISIRGLDASFNTVLFDGIRTGTADTFRRTALDIITSTDVSSIRVTKAPLPEDASEGIGGVVDIRTRGPLQRNDGVFLSADVRDNSFVDDNGRRFSASINRKLSDNFAVRLSGSSRVTYLDTLYVNPASFTLEQLNAITLTGPNGTQTFIEEEPLERVPQGFLNSSDFTNEQQNFEDNSIKRDNTTLSAVLDWQITDNTLLTFGGRYTKDETTQVTSNIEFDADNGDIECSDPAQQTLVEDTGDTSLCTAGYLQSTFPDPEVTFEGQIEDSDEVNERYFLRGETLVNNWTFDYVVGYSRAFEDEPILSIDFTNDFDDVPGGTADNDVTFVPLDFSGHPFTHPLPRDPAVFALGIDPFCENPDESSGRCGEINDFDEALEDSRENERMSARFDATYEFDSDGPWTSLKFGVQYENSEYTDLFIDISDRDDSLGPNGEFLGIDESGAFGGSLGDNNAVLGSYGLVDGSESGFGRLGNPFTDIGLTGVPLFDPERLRGIRASFRQGFFESGSIFEDLVLVESEEDFLSAYIQPELNFGRLQVIGGVRVEAYDGKFSAPSSFDASVSFDPGTGGDSIPLADSTSAQNVTETDNFEALPRFALNYELTDNSLLRFSYTTAIARPTFNLLAAEVDGDFDIELTEGVALNAATSADVANVDIDFSLGNPDLDNAYSQAFDLSYEYYRDDENAFSVAVFYKTIDDFIFNSFAIEGQFNETSLQFDPIAAVQNAPFSPEGLAIIEQLGGIDALIASGNAQVDISQPANGEEATVYGLELGFFHSMSYLPGPLSNLGLFGNVTFQETEIDLELGTLGEDDALVTLGFAQAGDTFRDTFELFNAPDVVGNVALFYSDEAWEATLAYRYQGVQLEEVGTFGLSQYQQERGFLDFDLEYAFDLFDDAATATVFFSANDILDDGTEPTTYESRGRDERFQDFAAFNGRSYILGARMFF